MTRRRTKYRHIFNPDGSLRADPCPGKLIIITEPGDVYTQCDTCGEGYRFKFIWSKVTSADKELPE